MTKSHISVLLLASLLNGSAAGAAALAPSAVARLTRELQLKVEELTGGVKINGFFDVTVAGYAQNPNIFSLGAFELDLKQGFGSHVQLGAALVFSDAGASLGVGFIDFRLFGGLVPARGRVFLESGLHFQVGKFDVPFGNDWQYFAALDRATISAPLTTTQLMAGGYNDVGVRLFGNYHFVDFACYLLRGVDQGLAGGGRIGLVPFNDPYTLRAPEAQPLVAGFSYLLDVDTSGRTDERVLAVDLEGRLGPVRAQAEYLRRDSRRSGLLSDGFHGTLFVGLLESWIVPLQLYGRYELLRVRPRAGVGEETTLGRLTGGAQLRAMEVAILKLEYAHYLRGDLEHEGGAFIAQLVIGFK